MENDALLKMEIKITGKVCQEESETNIRIYFFQDYVSRDIKNIIENIKKLLKKYDKIEKIYMWISESSEIHYNGEKTIDGVKYNFHELTKSIYDKNNYSFIEFTGYTEEEVKKFKNDAINDILNTYSEAQKIYIQKLQQRLKEVV